MIFQHSGGLTESAWRLERLGRVAGALAGFPKATDFLTGLNDHKGTLSVGWVWAPAYMGEPARKAAWNLSHCIWEAWYRERECVVEHFVGHLYPPDLRVYEQEEWVTLLEERVDDYL